MMHKVDEELVTTYVQMIDYASKNLQVSRHKCSYASFETSGHKKYPNIHGMLADSYRHLTRRQSFSDRCQLHTHILLKHLFVSAQNVMRNCKDHPHTHLLNVASHWPLTRKLLYGDGCLVHNYQCGSQRQLLSDMHRCNVHTNVHQEEPDRHWPLSKINIYNDGCQVYGMNFNFYWA